MELNWVPFLGELVRIISWLSDAVLKAALQCYDDHMTWQLIIINLPRIFILRSLINKYRFLDKKKILRCFVDFKKAFDSMWHEGHMFKLLKLYGVCGKFYGALKHI